MFGSQVDKKQGFNTRAENTSGSMQLLLNALSGLGENAGDISKNAGNAIADDRLKAMTPEERNGTNVLDKMNGLALTDKFRERLALGEKNAEERQAAEAKNDFMMERDKQLNEYDKQGDYRRSALRNSENSLMAKLNPGKSKGDITTTPEDNLAMQQIDTALLDAQTAIAANDTQSGISLENRAATINELRKAKYDLLRKQGYPEVTARDAAYKDDKSLTALLKQIMENNKNNISKK